ncbi:hypothetical protein BDN72DRAFT_898690 [Pluteus cervinus]|uniref:Uncharacterized protein n=1 Tax=Pluteus cervinus TaxID=181527 RepID=A0ACD3AR49_9AGAR|nr:hypothetical protein BDN72DRAFT_898690 [Pluteus cervinus]
MLLITPHAKFSPAIRDVVNHPCPISTIPIELLQEIFTFSMTVKPDPPIRASIPMDEREPPIFQATALILTWVCSQWRQIALSMPELWGTMNIYKPKDHCVDLVKIYLSRAGDSTPLHLYLRQGRVLNRRAYDQFPEHGVTVDILRLWVPEAHRWKSIFLDMSYTPPLHELPNIPSGALSGLQEAHLHFSETPQHSNTVIKWLWDNIFLSPALRTAYWHDFVYGLPPAPFSQLSEFELLAPTADELLSILPSCQRLRRLKVDLLSSATHSMTRIGPIIFLPSLQYFQLDFGEHSMCILDQISAPVLRELVISDSRQMPFSEVRSLEQFLQRSRCSLRALRLQQRQVDDETHLIRYFTHASKHLAGLEVLRLDCDMLTERAISLFVPHIVAGTISIPFPCMVDLQLCDLVSRDGVISSMVESRSAAGAPLWVFLCRVRSGSPSIGYPKDVAAFDRLREAGLQLFWSAPNGPITL